MISSDENIATEIKEKITAINRIFQANRNMVINKNLLKAICALYLYINICLHTEIFWSEWKKSNAELTPFVPFFVIIVFN